MDASAIVDALLTPDVAKRLDAFVGDAMTLAPDVVDVEVLSGLRRAVLRQTSSEEDARDALEDFLVSPLERVPSGPFLRSAWELRHNLTAADAIYVAVAGAFSATLITADRRLAGAPGLGVAVTVLPS